MSTFSKLTKIEKALVHKIEKIIDDSNLNDDLIYEFRKNTHDNLIKKAKLFSGLIDEQVSINIADNVQFKIERPNCCIKRSH